MPAREDRLTGREVDLPELEYSNNGGSTRRVCLCVVHSSLESGDCGGTRIRQVRHELLRPLHACMHVRTHARMHLRMRALTHGRTEAGTQKW